MANRYARAAGGNWSSAGTWATSSGGTEATDVPTAADDVFIDSASGNVTIDATAVCRSINCTGYTGTLTHAAGITLSIGDATAGASNIALKFVVAMTYAVASSTSTIAFISTSATVQTIDFTSVESKSGNVTFNGAGGSWQLVAGFSTGWTTNTITLTQGTLNVNGQTCSWGIFSSSNSNTRTLTLGAADITITGTASSSFDINTATGITITANTSTITFSPTSGGGLRLTGINLNGASIVANAAGAFNINASGNTATVANFTRTGTAVKTDSLSLSGNLTCTGTFTCNGNSSINRVHVYSGALGTARTITAATVAVTNTDFQDITGAGAGSWDLSAVSGGSGDCGGNTNITFTTAAAQYYGGAGLTGSFLRLNGVASNYVYTSDSVQLSITTDIDLQARISLDDWTPTANTTIIGKRSTVGANRAYLFEVGTTGTLRLILSTNGTANLTTAISSATMGFTDGTAHWIRATYVKSTGVVQFFTSDDSESIPSSWTQLGTDVTIETTGIADTNANLTIGSYEDGGTQGNATGKFYRIRVLSGATVAFDANFATQTLGASTFSEGSSNAATVYIKAQGGNWSTSTLWYRSTGAGRVPLPQDDVYLGAGFNASQTVTADMPRLGKTIDWTGATGSPTWSLGTGVSIYGSLTVISGVTLSGNQTVTFGGRSTFTLTSAGKAISGTSGITFSSPGATYTLQDALVLTGGLTLNNGTLVDGGNSVTCTTFTSSGSLTRALTKTGAWSLISTAATNIWNSASTLALTDSGSITISNTSTNTRTFIGGGLTYGTLTYTAAGSTGKLTITGSNTFNNINFSDASNIRTLELTAATTTTIAGSVNGIAGTSRLPMTVKSTTNGTVATIASSVIVNPSFVNLIDITASGTGPFYATNSQLYNSTGWTKKVGVRRAPDAARRVV